MQTKENKDFTKDQCAFGAWDEYDCPKCGIVRESIDVIIKGHGVEGKYCLVCWAKWCKMNIPLLKPRVSNEEA